MVAYVAAGITKNGKQSAELLERYIESKRENWAANAIGGSGGNWETQLALRARGNRHLRLVTCPLGVVKKQKIYLPAGTPKVPDASGHSTHLGWEFGLAVGDIPNGVRGTRELVAWCSPKSPNAPRHPTG